MDCSCDVQINAQRIKMLCLIILCARVLYSLLVWLCICQWKLQLGKGELKERNEWILYGKESSAVVPRSLLPIADCMVRLLGTHSFSDVLLKLLRGWHKVSFVPEEPQRAVESLSCIHTMKTNVWETSTTGSVIILAALCVLPLIQKAIVWRQVSLPGWQSACLGPSWQRATCDWWVPLPGPSRCSSLITPVYGAWHESLDVIPARWHGFEPWYFSHIILPSSSQQLFVIRFLLICVAKRCTTCQRRFG